MHPLEAPTFQLAFLVYFVSLALSGAYMLSGARLAERGALAALTAGVALQTLNLTARSLEAGRAPFSNLYESLAIFAWGTATCLLAVQWSRKTPAAGLTVLPLVLAALGYASTLDARIEPLMPALRSPWMFYHVAAAILAYGAFAVAGGLGMLYLIRHSLEKRTTAPSWIERLPGLGPLDTWTYSTIAFAFPFMVLVLVTGAIWAQKAWGTYWQWDPKETWALITTLFYAGYLHARQFTRWRGLRSAWLAVIGFLVVVFTYLGVNLLLSGLHSYASG
jgi:cytochrome c-type biogenesis protein CcsB